MPNKGAILRALIDKGEHFVCGDTYSAITGRICSIGDATALMERTAAKRPQSVQLGFALPYGITECLPMTAQEKS